MILKQKAFQELVQMMKLKENHENVSHPGIEPACITKTQCAWSGTVQRRNHPATEPSISPSVITCTVQVTRTSWLRQTTTRIFVKLQKYVFLKQSNFMRIDELPHHSSLFSKLNFVSSRQFFINIGIYPPKMQKVRNDPLLYNKIFKRVALFPY